VLFVTVTHLHSLPICTYCCERRSRYFAFGYIAVATTFSAGIHDLRRLRFIRLIYYVTTTSRCVDFFFFLVCLFDPSFAYIVLCYLFTRCDTFRLNTPPLTFHFTLYVSVALVFTPGCFTGFICSLLRLSFRCSGRVCGTFSQRSFGHYIHAFQTLFRCVPFVCVSCSFFFFSTSIFIRLTIIAVCDPPSYVCV